MIRCVKRATAAFVLAIALAPVASAADAGPEARYGGDIVFSIWRSGDRIGQQRMSFARKDGGLVVDSKLDLAVKFLGVTLYRYGYAEREIWRDGVLSALTATIDDDGTRSTVSAERLDDRLAVTGPQGAAVVAGAIFPSGHWNPQVIGTSRVLNTITGKIDQVTMLRRGDDTVATAQGEVAATHYSYTGDLAVEVWYDRAGHWVGLQFDDKRGVPIKYLCERCGLSPETAPPP